MKIIKSITGQCEDSSNAPDKPAAKDVVNTQSQKGFWRRKRVAKNGTYYESSSGGSVFISIDEEWALAEAHEPKCCIPKSVDNSDKKPTT